MRSSSRSWVPRGAEDDRAALRRAHEDEPDAGVLEERPDQVRVALGEALQRDSPGLAREADEPQAAGGHHHDLGRLVALLELGPGARLERHRPAGAAPAGGRRHRTAGHRGIVGDLGEPGAEVGQGLVLAAGMRLDVAGPTRLADEVLERHAVTVLEGRALRLAVIGQHDELVGPRRVRDGRPDAGELAVDLTQHGQRVVALDPRVVRDLVVGEEGRVDDGPPGHHVADDGGDLQVALHHRRPRAHERVHARARDPRLHVVADLARGGAALADVVGEREQPGVHDGIGAREVGGVVASERPAPAHQDGAHREHRVWGVARQDVRAAGAVLVQQPAPVGVATLQLLGVARVVGDDRAAAILLPPAEGRHVVVVAVQQTRLAGSGLRGPVGLPALQPVAVLAQPARHDRRVAVAQRAAQHLVGEAVDLQEDHPGDVRRDGARPAGLAAQDVALPGLVVIDGQQRGGRRRDHRHPHGHHDAREPAVDAGARADRRRDGHERRR